MPLPDPGLIRTARDESQAKVFVETGTHRGDGIAMALAVGGFQDYYSVETSAFAYGWSCHRFQALRGRVHLHHEDSRDFLRALLPAGPGGGIYGPCVLWLDAHWCGGDGEMGNDVQAPPPLLDELAIIAAHRCKTHAVLIDDVRNFGTELPTRAEVEAAVYAINPAYRVRYVDGRDFPADILVATVPPEESE